jgi:hypothetical protein
VLLSILIFAFRQQTANLVGQSHASIRSQQRRPPMMLWRWRRCFGISAPKPNAKNVSFRVYLHHARRKLYFVFFYDLRRFDWRNHL